MNLNEIQYVLRGEFRPAVISKAAVESRLDAVMKVSPNETLLTVRSILKNFACTEDLKHFENRMKIGQVLFERKETK